MVIDIFLIWNHPFYLMSGRETREKLTFYDKSQV